MTETRTTDAADAVREPKHALRRHLTGRYHDGLIPVALLLKANRRDGRLSADAEPTEDRAGE